MRRHYTRTYETIVEDWLVLCRSDIVIDWVKNLKVYTCPTCKIPTLLSVWTSHWTTQLPKESLLSLVTARTQLPLLHIDLGVDYFRVRRITSIASYPVYKFDNPYDLSDFLNALVCCNDHFIPYRPQDETYLPTFSLEPDIDPVDLERWHREFFPSEWRLSDIDFIVFVDGKLNSVIEGKTLFTFGGDEIVPTTFTVTYSRRVADLLGVPLHLLIVVNTSRGWFVPFVRSNIVEWNGKVSHREKVIDFMIGVLTSG